MKMFKRGDRVRGVGAKAGYLGTVMKDQLRTEVITVLIDGAKNYKTGKPATKGSGWNEAFWEKIESELEASPTPSLSQGELSALDEMAELWYGSLCDEEGRWPKKEYGETYATVKAILARHGAGKREG